MILLQIAAGLIFILVLFTLLATAIQELIANYISLRGVMLMKTIQHILEPGSKGVRGDVYNSFINSLSFKQLCRPSSSSAYGRFLDWLEEKTRYIFGYGGIGKAVDGPPSFISAENFTEVLKRLEWKPEYLESIPPGPLRDYLDNMGEQAEDKAQAKMAELKRWYDEVMNATSNWYRRQAQFILIFIGFALAASFNINLLEIGKTLSKDEILRTQLYSDMEKWMAERADTYFDENGQVRQGVLVTQNEKNIIVVDPGLKNDLKQSDAVQQLIGQKVKAEKWTDWLLVFANWLLTAIFISFGAPFWFDLLRKLVRVAKPV